MATNKSMAADPEILAISLVYDALKDLNAEAQQRVIDYVAQKLNLKDGSVKSLTNQGSESANIDTDIPATAPHRTERLEPSPDDLDGISPVALRWMRRNGLTADRLSAIFSLGVDEIDLVAKKAPGKSRRARMQNVFLLKGVAAYLSTGAARFTHEQIKEACLHYDAFDTDNFASYLKDFSAEVSGTKESGYTLTARGLTAATEIIKEMIGTKDKS